MRAIPLMTAKAVRIAGTRPITGVSLFQITGAEYAAAVPAIKVREIAVNVYIHSCPVDRRTEYENSNNGEHDASLRNKHSLSCAD